MGTSGFPLSDFFGDGQSGGRAAMPPAQQRQVERVDVTQFFSDATRELLQRAAHTALEWGSLDLVENELSKMVLGGSVQPGDKVIVSLMADDLHFEIEAGAAQELVAEEEPAGAPA